MPLDELVNFVNGGNVIVSTKLENYEKVFIDTINYFLSKNMSGVILSLNKSYAALMKTFETNKVDTKNLTFIDSITYNEEKREGNCIYLSRPFNATNASIVIDELLKTPSNKFFVFDSLTTMLLSYDPVVTVKFFQYNLPKFASQKRTAIIFAIDVDTKNESTNLIVRLCDKIVTV